MDTFRQEVLQRLALPGRQPAHKLQVRCCAGSCGLRACKNSFPEAAAHTDLPLPCMRKQPPTTTKWHRQRAMSSTLALKHTGVHQSMGCST